MLRGSVGGPDAHAAAERQLARELADIADANVPAASMADVRGVGEDALRAWVEAAVRKAQGFEDDILSGMVVNQVRDSADAPDPRRLRLALAAFWDADKARLFTEELWAFLREASPSRKSASSSSSTEPRSGELREQEQASTAAFRRQGTGSRSASWRLSPPAPPLGPPSRRPAPREASSAYSGERGCTERRRRGLEEDDRGGRDALWAVPQDRGRRREPGSDLWRGRRSLSPLPRLSRRRSSSPSGRSGSRRSSSPSNHGRRRYRSCSPSSVSDARSYESSVGKRKRASKHRKRKRHRAYSDNSTDGSRSADESEERRGPPIARRKARVRPSETPELR